MNAKEIMRYEEASAQADAILRRARKWPDFRQYESRIAAMLKTKRKRFNHPNHILNLWRAYKACREHDTYQSARRRSRRMASFPAHVSE